MSIWNTKWIGGLGGGVGGGALVGGEYHRVHLYNMGSDAKAAQYETVYVKATRAGPFLGIEAANALCYVDNAPRPEQLDGLQSNGWDVGIDLVFGFDNAFKSSGRILLETAKVLTSGTTAKIKQEAAKKAGQYVTGHFKPTTAKPVFYVIPTIASVGFQLGVWYAWQTMHRVGTGNLWSKVKPNWTIAKDASGHATLQFRNVPEKGGVDVNVYLRLVQVGRDSVFSINGSKDETQDTAIKCVTVADGKLIEKRTRAPIRLSDHAIDGVWAWQATGRSRYSLWWVPTSTYLAPSISYGDYDASIWHGAGSEAVSVRKDKGGGHISPNATKPTWH